MRIFRLFQTKTLVFLTLISLTFSCTGDDENIISNLSNLEVTLELAEGLSDVSLSGLEVVVTNTTDNSVYTATSDAEGLAVFSNIAAATYNLVVSESLEEYTLSGALNSITLVSGETSSETVEINAVNTDGGLVIKEIYSVGANDFYSSLFKDQFIEIFNNSSETLYADGMYIANLYGQTGTAGQDSPITDVLSTDEYVYADSIDQIPGDGTDYPVASGQSIVIALNAINFKEGNTYADAAIDNTDVTLERYSVSWLEEQGRTGNSFFDLDNPDVENMTNIYIYESTNFYGFNSYGTGAVLINSDQSFTDTDIVDYTPEGSTTIYKLMQIAVSSIIDGVDILENSTAADFKRLPNAIDAGFSYVNADGGAFYSGKSSRRVIDETATARFGRTILQDTNNSSVDFETIDNPDKYGYNN